MRTLIVGIGALGGTIATRAVSAGMPVWLATRTGESARALRASGLRVSGVGGTAAAGSVQAAVVADYRDQHFDLILLATKAHEALEIAPFLSTLLTPGGTLLCIQNGGVSQILSDRLGTLVLGGVSNLGAICGNGSSEEGGSSGDPDNDGDANGVETGRTPLRSSTAAPTLRIAEAMISGS